MTSAFPRSSPIDFANRFRQSILPIDFARVSIADWELDSNFNGNTLSTTDGADVTDLTCCH